MKVTIKNLLEVLPGNIILVPGCEPISAFTSPTLAANMDCKASTITLATALEVCPGSTITRWPMSGGFYVKRFFVLPDGPPTPVGCEETSPACQVDWYQILRDNADGIGAQNDDTANKEMTVDQICELFSLKF